MHHLAEPTGRRRETRRHRTVPFMCQGMVALMLAGLFVPPPGMIATIAIAGTGLVLMGLQHFISRQLAKRSAELIARQEALLAQWTGRKADLFSIADAAHYQANSVRNRAHAAGARAPCENRDSSGRRLVA